MAVLSRVARPRNVALAAVLAANGVLAQAPSCFNLQGFTDDGSTVTGQFVQVSSGGTDTFTAGFIEADTEATAFGLDATTGVLSDLTNPDMRLANIDTGFTFDYIFFDNQAVIDEFDMDPINCSTDVDGVLTCAADDPTVNIINYCEGVLALGQSVRDDFGCQGIILVATEAECPVVVPGTTTTTSTSSTETSTSTITTGSDTTTTTSSSITSDSTVDPASTGGSTSVVLTTSTVFATETLTLTTGDATSVSTSVYPLYTTVCPVDEPAPQPTAYATPAGSYNAPAGGYGGDGSSAGGYKAPAYNPGHLAALPATVCAQQLNAVASKYPAGAMNSYSDYGVTPVTPAPGYGDNTGSYSGGEHSGGENSGYGDNSGYENNNGGENGGYKAPAGGDGSNSGGYPGKTPSDDNSGSYAPGAGKNGSAAGYPHGGDAGAASGTGYAYPTTTPLHFEGSASTVKMAFGGVFAAAVALVYLL